jgi:hypothetical protein
MNHPILYAKMLLHRWWCMFVHRNIHESAVVGGEPWVICEKCRQGWVK